MNSSVLQCLILLKNLFAAANYYQYYYATIYVQRLSCAVNATSQISDAVHCESLFATKSMHTPLVPQILDFSQLLPKLWYHKNRICSFPLTLYANDGL